jgi:hypothetical protein
MRADEHFIFQKNVWGFDMSGHLPFRSADDMFFEDVEHVQALERIQQKRVDASDAMLARALAATDQEVQEVAVCLSRYLSWYFDSELGQEFLARRMSCNEVDPEMPVEEIPIEVEVAQRAMVGLKECLDRPRTCSKVPWRDLLILMEAHGLSELQAFHPKYCGRDATRFTLDVAAEDAKLRTDADFIRRSQIFHDLAYADRQM